MVTHLSLEPGRRSHYRCGTHSAGTTRAAATYSAAMLSGWITPKFRFATVCMGSSFFLIANSIVIYSMVTTTFQDLWVIDDMCVTLSVIVGAIAAIVHAKDNFHEKKQLITM